MLNGREFSRSTSNSNRFQKSAKEILPKSVNELNVFDISSMHKESVEEDVPESRIPLGPTD